MLRMPASTNMGNYGCYLLSMLQAECLLQIWAVARYVALAHTCVALKAAARRLMPPINGDVQRCSAQSGRAARPYPRALACRT